MSFSYLWLQGFIWPYTGGHTIGSYSSKVFTAEYTTIYVYMAAVYYRIRREANVWKDFTALSCYRLDAYLNLSTRGHCARRDLLYADGGVAVSHYSQVFTARHTANCVYMAAGR